MTRAPGCCLVEPFWLLELSKQLDSKHCGLKFSNVFSLFVARGDPKKSGNEALSSYIILKISISLSLVAPMAISGNCRCVFGPHFPQTQTVSLVWRSKTMVHNLDTSMQYITLYLQIRRFRHNWVEERVCCSTYPLWLTNHCRVMANTSLTEPAWDFSWECRHRHPIRNTVDAAGFHQQAIGSISTVLAHLAIDSDLTDIYLNGILPDYYFK